MISDFLPQYGLEQNKIWGYQIGWYLLWKSEGEWLAQ